MIRLRCWQQRLLLAVVVFVVEGQMIPPWKECGILNYCIVHKSCFGAQSANEKGWIHFKNLGDYSNPKAPPKYEDGHQNCERYITISPVIDAGTMKVTVRMKDKLNLKSIALKLFFEKASDTQAQFLCHRDNRAEVEHASNFEGKQGDIIQSAFIDCTFNVLLLTSDNSDIRQKLTELAGGKFSKDSNGRYTITTKGTLAVTGNDIDTDGNSIAYEIQKSEVDLTALKMLCSGDRVALLDKADSVDGSEFQPESRANLLQSNPKYVGYRSSDGSIVSDKVLEDEARVQCPADAPMHYKSDVSKGWKPLKDGLICFRGFLVIVNEDFPKNRVTNKDVIKCARKRCGTCEAPASVTGIVARAPKFDAAEEGDRCRTLWCEQPFMIVKLKGSNSAKLHRKQWLNCSANPSRTLKEWELDDSKGEINEAACATEVDCKLVNPLETEKCENAGNNATCHEPSLLNVYDPGRGPCPPGFDPVYVAPVTGNQILLSSFKCDLGSGRWSAKDRQNGVVRIVDHATLRCEKTKEEKKSPKPFLGMSTLTLACFGGGIFLVVVAVIVVATFYICRVKKRKAAKKKAMESVSQTFKEIGKDKKKGGKSSRRDKRKERQVSVANSMTGSGPASLSGPASSTPIAPPSQLLTPSKGISKPDKGCAVLDLTTGQSKNLKWTNHAGDGPPTQRPEVDSNQEDAQSAIKFAPGELEAARRKNQYKKKKEKSRQNSIEYNLGDPKQVKVDKSNIMPHDLDESSTIKF